MIGELKPYEKYKETVDPWLGKVPTHWTIISLGVLTTSVSRRNRSDLPLLSVVREKGVIVRSITDSTENHNFIPDDLSNYKVVRKGNLVINKMKAWQGSMGVSAFDGIVSPAYYVFDFRLDEMKFGHLLLRSKPYVSFFAQASDGVRIGQWDLSLIRMRRIPIAVPPVEEQMAIAHFLDYADRRIRRYIRTKQKLIKLLEEQKQAVINEAVTRGLDPDAPLKPSRIEGVENIPEHWTVLPLKALSKVQTGITLGKKYLGQQLVEIPYLRVANVQAGHTDLSTVKKISVLPHEAERSLLQYGDVLMTEGGDPDKLGRGCVWEGQIERCIHQNHIFAVRPKDEKLRPRYLSALLGSQYSKNYFLLTAKQTTNLASTNKTNIGQLPILLPDVQEQDEILEALEIETESIRKSLSSVRKEIDLLREFRTRLIADVVTGKLDVREAAAKLPVETEDPELSDPDLTEDDIVTEGDFDEPMVDEAA